MHKAISLGVPSTKKWNQLIKKSAELFRIEYMNHFLQIKTWFLRNNKLGRLNRFKGILRTCVEKIICGFCRNMTSWKGGGCKLENTLYDYIHIAPEYCLLEVIPYHLKKTAILQKRMLHLLEDWKRFFTSWGYFIVAFLCLVTLMYLLNCIQ